MTISLQLETICALFLLLSLSFCHYFASHGSKTQDRKQIWKKKEKRPVTWTNLLEIWKSEIFQIHRIRIVKRKRARISVSRGNFERVETSMTHGFGKLEFGNLQIWEVGIFRRQLPKTFEDWNFGNLKIREVKIL